MKWEAQGEAEVLELEAESEKDEMDLRKDGRSQILPGYRGTARLPPPPLWQLPGAEDQYFFIKSCLLRVCFISLYSDLSRLPELIAPRRRGKI